MAGALAVLGAVLVGLGALTEAEAARCESMRLWQSLRGAEHFEVGVALTNLAAVQHARDDLPAARSHWQHALRIKQPILGDRHPEVVALRRHLLAS
jgi:hypothetical protein